MPNFNLSVIVIVRDEERDLPDCLESVKDLSHDIVVVDSGSADKTLDVARRYSDKVFFHEWQGYSLQKQFALEQAEGDWVLNLDADERVTADLAEEIKKRLSDPGPINGFLIPFRTFVFARQVRFGSARGEKHLRLFRRGFASYGTEAIHEGIRVQSPLAALKGKIDHYSYDNLADYLEKCHRYTSLIAEKKYTSGRRFHWWDHLRLPGEFFVRYILKFGFLDGGIGFVYAALSSYYVWLKFLKLKDLETNKP